MMGWISEKHADTITLDVPHKATRSDRLHLRSQLWAVSMIRVVLFS